MMSSRAVKPARKELGSRLRTMRKRAGFSQEGLGHRVGLSGKFIGEVERAEKSISVDSLIRVMRPLRKPASTMLRGLR